MTQIIEVLLCGHVAGAIGPEVLAGPGDPLSGGGRQTQVKVIADICRRPPTAWPSTSGHPNGRLVVALCAMSASALHIDVYARRSGYDPFCVQVVEAPEAVPQTAACSASESDQSHRGCVNAELVRRLRAACARAAAYPGALPENRRATLPGASQSISRRDFLTMPPVRYRVAPTIDATRCRSGDGCNLCLSSCPPGAIAANAGGYSVNRATCTACGVCLEVCPESAIEMPGASPAEISAEVAELLDPAAPGLSLPIAFYCREGPTPKLQRWAPVRVTCVNTLPVAVALQALADGATAVGLVVCRRPCPGADHDRAAGKVGFGQALLRAIGVQGESLTLLDPSGAPSPPESPRSFRSGSGDQTHPTHGKAAAAGAVRRLTGAYQATNTVLEHPMSPLGIVVIEDGACTVCGTCAGACPTGALRTEQSSDLASIAFDPSLCSGCGKCVAACPELASGAIRVSRVVNVPALRAGRQAIVTADVVRCTRCGEGIASVRMMARIRTLVGDAGAASPITQLCGACRSAPWTTDGTMRPTQRP